MKLICRMLVSCAGLLATSCTQVTVEKLPVEPEVPLSNCLRGWGLSPASAALYLGDSTRFSLALNCDLRLPAAVRWASGNSAIAEKPSARNSRDVPRATVSAVSDWRRSGGNIGAAVCSGAFIAPR